MAAAAYRHATKMHSEWERKDFSYASKHDVEFCEIMLPPDAPKWIREHLEGRSVDGASEALWNSVEVNERNRIGQLAREVEVALPVELTVEENLDLVREFCSRYTERGQVVDFAFHNKPGNPHVHIMTTMRPLTEDGWGQKRQAVLDESGEPKRLPPKPGQKRGTIIREAFLPRDVEALKAERADWAELVNRHLALKGIEQRVDHRSHADRGFEINPTEHRGIFGNELFKRGVSVTGIAAKDKSREENLATLMLHPEQVVRLATEQKSVIDTEDIARVVFRYAHHGEAMNAIIDKVLASPELVQLTDEAVEAVTGKVLAKARFTSRTLIAIESQMVERAARMQQGRGATRSKAAKSISEKRVNAAIAKASQGRGFTLSDEQSAAVHAVTDKGSFAAVVGLAGAGKSTMLEAARIAWEGQGLRVRGLALAGKAVEELAKSSGIESRTMASLQDAQSKGLDSFSAEDVVVIDEAGMAGSRQLAAEASGAKVVLVGDPDQLPAISAGAAFRGIVEVTGYTEMSEVRRQSAAWMRQASVDFARGNIAEAIGAYRDHNCIAGWRLQDEAKDALAKDVASNVILGIRTAEADDNATTQLCRGTVALSHANHQVEDLNARIREELITAGVVSGEGSDFRIRKGQRDAAGRLTDRRTITVASGDRIVMLSNDRRLGVKNGSLAVVRSVKADKLDVTLDDGRELSFDPRRYNTFEQGWALTIHKSQGATFDHAHVLATRTMNRNLAYVAMTRHKDTAALYYGRMSFPKELFEGGLVEALSRPAGKAISTDYANTAVFRAAVAYGRRRGYGPVRAMLSQMRRAGLRTLAAVTERLRGGTSIVLQTGSHERMSSDGMSSANVPPLLPAMPMPTDRSGFATLALDREPQVADFEARLKTACERAYVEPGPVFAALRREARASFTDRKAVRDHSEGLGRRAGVLKGDGLGAKLSKAKAKDVSRNATRVRVAFDDLAQLVHGTRERAGGRYDALTSQLAVEIPGVTKAEGQAFLKLAARMEEADGKGMSLDLRREAPAVMDKADALETAIEARFGGLASLRAVKSLDRPDDADRQRIAKSHGHVLRAAQTLKQAEAGWTTQRQHIGRGYHV